MKALFYFVLVAVWILMSPAQAYLYESEFYRMGANYISLLKSLGNDDINSLADGQRAACQYRYNKILNDGVIDIRIPIGYFDWTAGKPIVKDGVNYGYSPSIDLGAYAAISKLLRSNCRGRTQFCGFQKNGDYRFLKEVSIHGKKYPVRLEMHFSSSSESYNRNIGKNHGDQSQRSNFMEGFFSEALKNADAVFYLGHSRNGGGPDFEPPVFVSGTNKVNYNGYYKVKRPGYNVMMSAISSGRQPAILGLMSCDSRDHFLSSLRKRSPETGVISSTAVITIDEVYTALIGGIDALLRGQCQKTFYRSLRLTSRNRTYITMDGMFE